VRRRPVPHAFTLLAALVAAATGHAAAARPVVPPANHVVVVVMENKAADMVLAQPYVASLAAGGATFMSSYGVTHPSQPNYIALWAGSTLGVATNECPAPGAPFAAPNLGQAVEASGRTWRAYVEDLPSAGAPDCSAGGDGSSGLYTRKHAPWTQFANVDHSNERPYTDLAADLAAGTLPALAFVIPNNCHNTHNTFDPACDVPSGDQWLAANLPPILRELGPRGVLVLTWDEDDFSADNRIATVLAGPLVRAGVVSAHAITHVTVTRTIAELLQLPPPNDAVDELPITDVWEAPVPTVPATWGRLKLRYR